MEVHDYWVSGGCILKALWCRHGFDEMRLIWCIRKGKDRGFKNDLAACVSCQCRQRKRCEPYSELSLEEIAAANVEAKQNGHQVDVEFPLFESVYKE